MARETEVIMELLTEMKEDCRRNRWPRVAVAERWVTVLHCTILFPFVFEVSILKRLRRKKE